jgi:type I restriction enzyme S subunit
MTDLPESWEVCKIADVTTPVQMIASSNSDAREIRYIDISSIDNQRNRIAEPKRLSLADAPSRARQIVKSGDVLFSTVRPYLRNISAVPDHLDGQIASTGFSVLRAADGVVPAYLFFKVISRDFVSALTGEQYGVSYPAVKEEQVRSQPFELPPTAEQHRIVAKIEALFSELDAGQDSLTRAQAQLKLYRQSLLKAAFQGRLTADWRAANPDKLESPETLLSRIRSERDAWYEAEQLEWEARCRTWDENGRVGPRPSRPDPHTVAPRLTDEELSTLPELPEGWAYTRLSEIACIGSGVSVSKSRSLQDPIDVPYLRVANVQRGSLDLSQMKTMPVEKSQLPSLALRMFDVLFNEGGDRDKLGRGWVWENAVTPCITQNHVFRATLFHATEGRAKLLSHWGNSHGQDYFEKGGKQTTNLASINKTVLKALPVPVVPVAEIEVLFARLEAALSEVNAIETEITTALAKISALRQSILKQAFSGRLVPQDPADEPASALLARLRAAAPAPRTRRKTPA